MTCFSPLDHKALYGALARDAAVKAQGCTDAGMRNSLMKIAEHWAALALLCDSIAALQPESLIGGTSRQKEELRKRYGLQSGQIASPEPDDH